MAGQTSVESTDGRRHRHLHAPVPMLELHVHRVELRAPSLRSLPSLSALPRPHIPDQLRPHADPRSVRARALWLGGLGGLAVVGVLDWPVAAAVAAGTWVAERRTRSYLAERDAAAREPAEPTAVPAPRTATGRQTAATRRTSSSTGTRRTASTGTQRRAAARKTAAAAS